MKIGLAVGGADCVFDDLKKANELLGREYDVVAACNDIGTRLARLDHWCSLHPLKFAGWVAERKRNKLPMEYETWQHRNEGKYLRMMPGCHVTHDWGGSSGLFCVRVLLVELKCDRVVCVGIPMHRAPHFNAKAPWMFAEHHLKAWRKNLKEIKTRVRSMSGTTRELLGEPTRQWLGLGETIMAEDKKTEAKIGEAQTRHAAEEFVKFEVLRDFYYLLDGKGATYGADKMPDLQDEKNQGHHLVAHYAAGQAYTCRSLGHAVHIDKWVEEKRVRVMGKDEAIAAFGASGAKIKGTGVVE